MSRSIQDLAENCVHRARASMDIVREEDTSLDKRIVTFLSQESLLRQVDDEGAAWKNRAVLAENELARLRAQMEYWEPTPAINAEQIQAMFWPAS